MKSFFDHTQACNHCSKYTLNNLCKKTKCRMLYTFIWGTKVFKKTNRIKNSVIIPSYCQFQTLKIKFSPRAIFPLELSRKTSFLSRSILKIWSDEISNFPSKGFSKVGILRGPKIGSSCRKSETFFASFTFRSDLKILRAIFSRLSKSMMGQLTWKRPEWGWLLIRIRFTEGSTRNTMKGVPENKIVFESNNNF